MILAAPAPENPTRKKAQIFAGHPLRVAKRDHTFAKLDIGH
jgi:hypothetical protein